MSNLRVYINSDLKAPIISKTLMKNNLTAVQNKILQFCGSYRFKTLKGQMFDLGENDQIVIFGFFLLPFLYYQKFESL